MLSQSKYSSFLLAVILLAICTSATQALDIPPAPTYRVNDFASLLSQEGKNRLEADLHTFEKETSTQIVVATFPSLEGESLEDFTNRLFEAWKIGQKNKNNGVLLAIFVSERKVRIEVGYGLEGVLTDALSAQIIRNELAPEFRAGNTERGIEKAVASIQKAVRGEYKAEQPDTHNSISYAVLIVMLVILILVFKFGRSGMTVGPRRRHRGGFWTWGGTTFGGSGGGWNSSSGGGWGGGGGGGFSGGGGMSGGGGASGSW